MAARNEELIQEVSTLTQKVGTVAGKRVRQVVEEKENVEAELAVTQVQLREQMEVVEQQKQEVRTLKRQVKPAHRCTVTELKEQIQTQQTQINKVSVLW